MFDAVLFIARGQLSISTQRQARRMMAYSNLLIGEIIIEEFSKVPGNLDRAKVHLLDAHEAY
jgi:hypothetical protein